MTIFIFDLDGTISTQETLPIISGHFGIEEQIHELTEETVKGNIPFIESFIRRIHILGALPVDEVNALLANVPLYPLVVEFIRQHKENCIVATGNLGCWISGLMRRIDCRCFHSDAIVENNRVMRLHTILKKENVVSMYQGTGHKIVFIGDGNNDLEAMRLADVAVASGLTHPPARSILAVADYLAHTEQSLCRLLRQLV